MEGQHPAPLVQLRATNGAVYSATRANLEVCGYFAARLALHVPWGWAAPGPVDLDVDGGSLEALLRLLSYGPGAVPELPPSSKMEALRAMVLRDADYFGVPRPLWAHLEDAGPHGALRERVAAWERSGLADLPECAVCRARAVRAGWRCAGCKAPAGAAAVCRLESSHRRFTHALECPRCGIEFARRAEACLICGRESLTPLPPAH